MKSSRKVFGSDTRHSRYIHLCKDMNNNNPISLKFLIVKGTIIVKSSD